MVPPRHPPQHRAGHRDRYGGGILGDLAGNTVRYTYGAKNERLTETRFAAADPDGAGAAQPSTPLITRYAYSATNQLRFIVSAEGRVNEYRYNAAGQRLSEIDYTANFYTSVTSAETEIAAWVSAIADKSNSLRTDTTYDFRGNVATVTRFSRTDSAGAGIASADFSRTTSVYDQAGNLLSRLTNDGGQAETYAYDGLGRTIRFTNARGIGTRTRYPLPAC